MCCFFSSAAEYSCFFGALHRKPRQNSPTIRTTNHFSRWTRKKRKKNAINAITRKASCPSPRTIPPNTAAFSAIKGNKPRSGALKGAAVPESPRVQIRMPKQATIQSSSPEQTSSLGRKLGEIAAAGHIFTLSGDLGAGKTTLTQAIARGLGVPDSYYITSPTFSLLHEYPARIPLYHMDLYRLSGEDEIEDLGFIDYLYGDGLTVVEWPDRLGSLIPEKRLDIEILLDGDRQRILILTAHGAEYEKIIAALLNS